MVVTLALLDTLRINYSDSPHLVCIWLANKYVAAQAKPLLETNVEWEDFYKDWQSVLDSPTVDEDEKRWLDFMNHVICRS